MKFNFLQGDFSTGELAPRAQGHADSDAYKAGLKYAANVAPTRAGSLASRAGLEALVTGIDGNTGAASNLPVQHITIHDGPYGDFAVEVSPTGIRLLDKDGVVPWDCPPSSYFLAFTQQDGSFTYGDARTRTVYLKSLVASGARIYWLTKPSVSANPPIVDTFQNINWPGATTDHWILSGKIAGDSVTLRVQQATPANFQDIAVAPDVNGNFSVDFRPNIGGADENFGLRLITGAGDSATTLWGLKLTKTGVKTVHDTTAVIPVPAYLASKVPPTQERVRAAAFWQGKDFFVAFAGGPNNAYAGYVLRWTYVNQAFQTRSSWYFGLLWLSPYSLAQIQGANAVAVFQERLWYAVNLPSGKRAIRASKIGFVTAWAAGNPQGNVEGDVGTQPDAAGPRDMVRGPFVFVFAVPVETVPYAAQVPLEFQYHFPCNGPQALLRVYDKDSGLRNQTPDFTVAGHEFDYEALPYAAYGGKSLSDQSLVPGGYVAFSNAAFKGLQGAGNLRITRGALADDPLDLNLASPQGKIAWLNVLRGLMLGTTRNEKLFSDGAVLAIDPATGANFELRDESSYGADSAVPALDVNEHVLFVQRGRKVLRQAGINISSNGGLVSEDVGIAGEHLTKARIRSMCYLKSPVQRVVFAFDDGTGAVMTLVNRGVGMMRQTVPAFTRFTLPACFGGIYNVASLDGEEDSELWIGTENGVTLRAATFESDIVTKEVQILNVAPAAPTHLLYDTENPLPPVMDGWVRAPLVNQGGSQYAVGLPLSAVGQSAYVLGNGQLLGPYVVAAGGKVVFPANLNLDKTWVDKTGARRAQEVYVGLLYPEHRWTSLPIEGGNPVGASQNLSSRKPQLHLRFVDSYMPLVNGKRVAERGQTDLTDQLAARVTGDVRATEEGFQRAAVVDVVMDLPLRMEVSAIHGGVVMNNI